MTLSLFMARMLVVPRRVQRLVEQRGRKSEIGIPFADRSEVALEWRHDAPRIHTVEHDASLAHDGLVKLKIFFAVHAAADAFVNIKRSLAFGCDLPDCAGTYRARLVDAVSDAAKHKTLVGHHDLADRRRIRTALRHVLFVEVRSVSEVQHCRLPGVALPLV